MQWLGLSLPSVLAIFGVLAVAITALYLIEQRRRRVQVAYLPLFRSLVRDERRSARLSRLERLLSWLLMLLILLAIVAALGDPAPTEDEPGRALVLLIDAGETMSVREGGRTRLELARERARRVIEALAPHDRAIVGQLDSGVVPLSALTDDRAALQAALDEVRATHLPTRLSPATRFAADVLRDEARPELVVVSDGIAESDPSTEIRLSEPGAPSLRFLKVGTDAVDDIGIETFAARRYPLDRTHVEVLVRVRNHGESPLEANLRVDADGSLVHSETLTLEPSGSTEVILTDLSGADAVLSARLSTTQIDDAFDVDDEAVTRIPARKRSRVLLVGEGNRYLEAALLLDEYLRVQVAKPGEAIDPRDYDAVIYDGVLPAAAPGVPALYLLPQASSDGASPLRLLDETRERPFVGKVDADHPVTRFTSLADVNIRAHRRVRLSPGDRSIVRSEAGDALIASGTRAGQRFVALSFDPRASDLPMRVAWPLLVLNALDWLDERADDAIAQHSVGQPMRLTLAGGASDARVIDPSGHARTLPAPNGVLELLPTLSGLYQVDSGGFSQVAAVSRNQEGPLYLGAQSALANVPAQSSPAPANPTRETRYWPLLVAFALALLSLEWFLFHRRVTV